MMGYMVQNRNLLACSWDNGKGKGIYFSQKPRISGISEQI
jgi:hypothetical protein